MDHPQTPLKLAFSFCSNRPMEPRCAMSLAMMAHHMTAYGIPFVFVVRMQASLLPSARQECMEEALALGCSHQLWWDDDIEAPGDAPLRLLQHFNPASRPLVTDRDGNMESAIPPQDASLSPGSVPPQASIDVVCANYVRKQQDMRMTAIDFDDREIHSHNRMGLQPCSSAGMGLMMVNLDSLRGTVPVNLHDALIADGRIPEFTPDDTSLMVPEALVPPHFEVAYHYNFVPEFAKRSNDPDVIRADMRSGHRAEDRFFCRKLRAAGLNIYVDHGLSNWIQHWGSVGYNFNLWRGADGKIAVPPVAGVAPSRVESIPGAARLAANAENPMDSVLAYPEPATRMRDGTGDIALTLGRMLADADSMASYPPGRMRPAAPAASGEAVNVFKTGDESAPGVDSMDNEEAGHRAADGVGE